MPPAALWFDGGRFEINDGGDPPARFLHENLNAAPWPKKATGIVDRNLKSLLADIQQRTRSPKTST
jgi:hypothetical protein